MDAGGEPHFQKQGSLGSMAQTARARSEGAREVGTDEGVGVCAPTWGKPSQQRSQVNLTLNPMDRGAWRAIVHRVAKSWTRLK